MFREVMMPINGIMVPGLCPLYPIRPKDFLCPRVDKAEFSMDGFSEDRMLPGTDEAPYDGVNPPIGGDAQDLPRVENPAAGLTAEMDTSGMDTAGMSDVSAMSWFLLVFGKNPVFPNEHSHLHTHEGAGDSLTVLDVETNEIAVAENVSSDSYSEDLFSNQVSGGDISAEMGLDVSVS